jgi:hypothetical protein
LASCEQARIDGEIGRQGVAGRATSSILERKTHKRSLTQFLRHRIFVHAQVQKQKT